MSFSTPVICYHWYKFWLHLTVTHSGIDITFEQSEHFIGSGLFVHSSNPRALNIRGVWHSGVRVICHVILPTLCFYAVYGHLDVLHLTCIHLHYISASFETTTYRGTGCPLSKALSTCKRSLFPFIVLPFNPRNTFLRGRMDRSRWFRRSG